MGCSAKIAGIIMIIKIILTAYSFGIDDGHDQELVAFLLAGS
jgi:hypothetical protein